MIFCHTDHREDKDMHTNLQLLNVKQCAKFLGLARGTIYTWRKQGKIPYIQLGKRFVFPLNDLMAFLEMNKVTVKT
jgi:excisionase family DNA binding protein